MIIKYNYNTILYTTQERTRHTAALVYGSSYDIIIIILENIILLQLDISKIQRIYI